MVNKILSEQPAESSDQSGVLTIRDSNGALRQVPVKFELVIHASDWTSRYEAATNGNGAGVKLTVVHHASAPNDYRLSRNGKEETLAGNQTMIPFAGSDFWVADLGLEFFHWPKQLLLRKEMRRGQSCDVLESYNPHPAPGAYSRVVSWIDIDTDGIIHADAYDSKGDLLKEFDPKSFKKVQGQWELKAMEIDNVQADSRTEIEFHLDRRD